MHWKKIEDVDLYEKFHPRSQVIGGWRRRDGSFCWTMVILSFDESGRMEWRDKAGNPYVGPTHICEIVAPEFDPKETHACKVCSEQIPVYESFCCGEHAAEYLKSRKTSGN